MHGGMGYLVQLFTILLYLVRCIDNIDHFYIQSCFCRFEFPMISCSCRVLLIYLNIKLCFLPMIQFLFLVSYVHVTW